MCRPRSWQASCAGCEDDEIPSIWDQTDGSRRLMHRYIGQCNVQTDIKEAVFLGQGDNLVACGSDDGRVYIYHADSGTLVRVLDADEDVANCIQCHPTQAVLATSGIEQGVKIWSPGDSADRSDISRLVKLNQSRMQDGPQWYPRGVFQTAMRAHVLQTLSENPDLIPELRSLLVLRGGRNGPGSSRTLQASTIPASMLDGGSELLNPELRPRPGSGNIRGVSGGGGGGAGAASRSSDAARQADHPRSDELPDTQQQRQASDTASVPPAGDVPMHDAGTNHNDEDYGDTEEEGDGDEHRNPYTSCRMS